MKATYTVNSDARARHDMLKAMHDRVLDGRFITTSSSFRGNRQDQPTLPNPLGGLASALVAKRIT